MHTHMIMSHPNTMYIQQACTYIHSGTMLLNTHKYAQRHHNYPHVTQTLGDMWKSNKSSTCLDYPGTHAVHINTLWVRGKLGGQTAQRGIQATDNNSMHCSHCHSRIALSKYSVLRTFGHTDGYPDPVTQTLQDVQRQIWKGFCLAYRGSQMTAIVLEASRRMASHNLTTNISMPIQQSSLGMNKKNSGVTISSHASEVQGVNRNILTASKKA